MTAPMLNLGFAPSAAPAAGAGASAGQGESPAAGFEALLAALFGQTPVTATEPTAETKTAKSEQETEPKDETADSKDETAGADAQALAAMLAATPVVAPPTTDAPAEGETVEAPVTATTGGKAVATPELALIPDTPAKDGKGGVDEKPASSAPALPQAAASTDQKQPAPQPTAQAADLAAPRPPESAVAAGTLTAAQLEGASPAQPQETRRESRVSRGETRGQVAAADAEPADGRASPRAAAVAASDKPATPVEHPSNPGAQVDLPEAAANDTPQSRNHAPAETTAAANPAPLPAHVAPPQVRGAPETVANLAAHILKKLEGRSTRFDVELDPAGMGRVDVRMEIGLNGRLTAAMAFDNPNTAAELKSRAAELARALEQAGFDVSGGLSFDVAGDQNRSRQDGGGEQQASGSALRGRAFQAALEAAGESLDFPPGGQLNLRTRLMSGVDIRI